MKSYFLCFDYRGPGYDKFIFGVFQADLTGTPLIDFCRHLIRQKGDQGVDAYSAIVKVIAFNNVEL